MMMMMMMMMIMMMMMMMMMMMIFFVRLVRLHWETSTGDELGCLLWVTSGLAPQLASVQL